MLNHRSSGILAHITSLPSAYGIGDIGPSSYKFIDFLAASEQTYWQFLPTGPTNTIFGHSPYMSTSAFAGSPLLISPDLLYQQGLISTASLHNHNGFSPYLTDFDSVASYKYRLLKEAFSNFKPQKFPEYQNFLLTSKWLEDYAVFMTAKKIYSQAGWFSWPKELATKDPEFVKDFCLTNQKYIDYFRFEQFIFTSQWQMLEDYARQNNILLFGDLPIYVSYDSVDVWGSQDIFVLNSQTLKPTHIAGVPPDYFSATGQRWGNPLYNWHSGRKAVQKRLFQWWVERFRHLFGLVDMARIDHFRAFESYWSIPEENETAVEGEWLKGPGKSFFDEIFATLGPLNIVAEDLGIITKEVEQLRDELRFPGMKVLQFAFDNNPDNSFLPCNFKSPHSVIYTGTHDNDTTVGWYMSERLDDKMREKIKKMTNREIHDRHGIHRDLIYLAQSSISSLCILPLQDVLGFGNDCKMNSPGIADGNWMWRCAPENLTDEIQNYLRDSTLQFNRARRSTKDHDKPSQPKTPKPSKNKLLTQ